VSGDARGYSWAPFQPGHTVTLKHGAHSPRVVGPLAESLRARLAETAPWTAAPAYEAAVGAWSWCEAQCQILRGWLDEHGLLNDEGAPRAASGRLDRLEVRAANLRAQLGLDPQSMVRLLGGLSSIDAASAEDGLEALKSAGRNIRRAAERRALEQANGANGDC
jgi:hypothetical protein